MTMRRVGTISRPVPGSAPGDFTLIERPVIVLLAGPPRAMDMIAEMTADRDTLAAQTLAARRAAYAHEVIARFGPPIPPSRPRSPKCRARRSSARRPGRSAAAAPPHGPPPAIPESLYEDELVALDRAKGINNGQPSLHAPCIAALRLTRRGPCAAYRRRHRLLHRDPGGTGRDRVDAYEIEPALAARAVENLAPWPNVTVHAESATGRRAARGGRDLCQCRRLASRSVLARRVARAAAGCCFR